MKKQLVIRRLAAALCASGLLSIPLQAMASAFQLFEQDGASVGNYHAGYAAEADNASTAFYNPAGITRIKNPQLVVSGAAITPSIKYTGTVATNYINDSEVMGTTAQGGKFGFVPSLSYVTPINDYLGIGFSITVPFGADVDYGQSSVIRYAATESMVRVLDYSPSIGFKVTDKASLGVGFDIQRMWGEFDQVATVGDSTYDSVGINDADDTAYGYHLGGLYEFTPDTRIGISYHSQVRHHLTGDSTFNGLLADPDQSVGWGPVYPSTDRMNITLPPYTALSLFSHVHPQIAVMASVVYTEWDVIKDLVLQDVAGIDDTFTASDSIIIDIPQHYHNTINYSAGADFFVTNKIILRTGLGFDESPVTSEYRSVQVPDSDRYIIALGAHYQYSKAFGFDVGWNHFFFKDATINPPPQNAGAQQTDTNGEVHSSADVLSGQITWSFV
ncbi:MAG: hypothetical protein EPO11_11195 [Gammaproteobacteria bacterium]|nr:MAG: hypothetical protein EPO11_11195 [Gammaproteobacteria bacterium]